MNFAPFASFLRPVLPRLVSLGVSLSACCVLFFVFAGNLGANPIEQRTLTTKLQGQANQQKLSTATNENSGGAWTALGGAPGCNGQVVGSTVMANGDLVISGYFTACGDLSVPGLAKWNGSSWSRFPATGSTQTSSQKGGVTASGSNLYVYTNEQNFGGQDHFAGIAKWNGTSWSSINSRPTYGDLHNTVGQITNIVNIGNDLYVSGAFNFIDGVPAKNFARWDGVAWHSLGSTNGQSQITTMVAFNGSLHVGGNFTSIDGVAVNGVARWRNGAWEALGSGPTNSLSGFVNALTVIGDRLYVGGGFNFGGVGGPFRTLASWDGSQWEGVTLPSFLQSQGSVVKLASSSGNLFVACSDWRIGRWDGSNWVNLEPFNPAVIVQAPISTMAASQDALYVSGNFSALGLGNAYARSNKIAKWSGNRWHPMGVGSGVGEAVYTVTVSGSDVYVGGRFLTVGGLPFNHIARWDGRRWHQLGEGAVGPVRSIAVLGSDVYVAGDEYGSSSRSFVAKWDGRQWTPLFSNQNWFGGVSELAIYGNEIIAGGYFSTIGGVPAKNIARWNGSGWAALEGGTGNGVNDQVNEIVVAGNDVYVGGIFTSAGGIPANRIARWNSSGWSTLGNGIAPSSAASSDSVYAIVLHQNTIIAGGRFTDASGSESNHLAVWDGTTWTRRNTYANSFVTSLASMSGELYVGSVSYGVSRQRGGVWYLLGNGTRPTGVSAMAPMDNKLFAGGDFQIVANSSMPMASSNFAFWSDLPDQLASMDFE